MRYPGKVAVLLLSAAALTAMHPRAQEPRDTLRFTITGEGMEPSDLCDEHDRCPVNGARDAVVQWPSCQ
jgi:hypothetical protein